VDLCAFFIGFKYSIGLNKSFENLEMIHSRRRYVQVWIIAKRRKQNPVGWFLESKPIGFTLNTFCEAYENSPNIKAKFDIQCWLHRYFGKCWLHRYFGRNAGCIDILAEMLVASIFWQKCWLHRYFGKCWLHRYFGKRWLHRYFGRNARL